MYDTSGLVDDFGEGGKARSAWRMSKILQSQQKHEDSRKYLDEAEKIRKARGGGPEDDLKEKHYNFLLNFMDS